MAEWFKAAVLKTARGFTLPRGFESHPFRHLVRDTLRQTSANRNKFPKKYFDTQPGVRVGCPPTVVLPAPFNLQAPSVPLFGSIQYAWWVPCACTKETSVDNIWIAEGWSAFLIAMLILKTYAVLLYLLVRSEVGVPE